MASPLFFLLCILHSAIALTSGAMMMFYANDRELISKVVESTPHNQLLLRTSDSFSGLLLFTIGFLVFMVAFVKDSKFQSFFARGCVVLHIAMAIWRVWFERELQVDGHGWLKKVAGDVALGSSWVFFCVYSWRDKYD